MAHAFLLGEPAGNWARFPQCLRTPALDVPCFTLNQ